MSSLYLGLTTEQLMERIAFYDAVKPIMETRAGKRMMLEGRRQIAMERLTKVRQELKAINRELQG